MLKISVVVCAFNEEDNIKPCLNSLLSQEQIDPDTFEVVVIDNDSTDLTGELTRSFIDEHRNDTIDIQYFHIEHAGLSIGRNTGLFFSRAPIIAYIDADAVAHKNWVAELLKAWAVNPNADAIGGRIEIRNSQNFVARYLHAVFFDPGGGQAIIGANMSFRRNTLMRIGGFGDPFISRGDDSFLLQKLGTDRLEIHAPKAIVFHDRPTSIKQWLLERKSNGRMSRLIFGLLSGRKYPLGRVVFSRLIVLLGVITGFVLLWPNWSFFYLLAVSLLFLAKGVLKGYYRRFKAEDFPLHPIVLGIIWTVVSELGVWSFYWGWWREANNSLDIESAMQGTISDKHVLDEYPSPHQQFSP